jgi:ABC-type nickel/cobalt efflux system permease component RcnA
MSQSRSRKPPSSSLTQTTQLTDGQWVRSGEYTHHECCGCGLTHTVKYKLVSGVLYEQWITDRSETRKARRARKKD